MNKTIQTKRKQNETKTDTHSKRFSVYTRVYFRVCIGQVRKWLREKKKKMKKTQLQFTTVPREVPDIDAKPCAYADILRTFPIVCVFIINSQSIQRLLSRPIFFIVYDR